VVAEGRLSVTTAEGAAFGPVLLTMRVYVTSPPTATMLAEAALVRARLADGLSSLRIVPIPCPSAIVALLGLMRLTKNVSSGSKVPSPWTGTLMIAVAPPAGMVSVPDVAA
jgi:hypothetical protein